MNMARILPDLKAQTQRPNPGRTVIIERDEPFAHKFRFYQPEPKEPRPSERIADAIEAVAHERALRGGVWTPRVRRRPKPALYRPKDGNQAGPLFGIFDRKTGVCLARCRGVIHHVMAEAQKLAESQGGALSDVMVRIID